MMRGGGSSSSSSSSSSGSLQDGTAQHALPLADQCVLGEDEGRLQLELVPSIASHQTIRWQVVALFRSRNIVSIAALDEVSVRVDVPWALLA